MPNILEENLIDVAADGEVFFIDVGPDAAPPEVDHAKKIDNLFYKWSSTKEPRHGPCCGLKHLFIAVSFQKKSGYEGTNPGDMRPLTVITCNPGSFLNWKMDDFGGLIDADMYMVDDPIQATYDRYVSSLESGLPLFNYMNIDTLNDVAFQLHGEDRFYLPQGPMITPSGNYCDTTEPRTLPAGGVGKISIATYVGKPPAYLGGGFEMKDNFLLSKLFMTGSASLKKKASPKILKGQKKPELSFDVDSVVQNLRSLM